jgi:hypothetical protein
MMAMPELRSVDVGLQSWKHGKGCIKMRKAAQNEKKNTWEKEIMTISQKTPIYLQIAQYSLLGSCQPPSGCAASFQISEHQPVTLVALISQSALRSDTLCQPLASRSTNQPSHCSAGDL